MKDLIIIGAGGVGREVALIIESIQKEWNPLGFVDDNPEVVGSEVCGYKVLGTVDYLRNIKAPVWTVCALADYAAKKNIVESLKDNPLIKFATIIHPSSEVNRTVEVGEGTIIYQNAVFTANIKIGAHCIISPKTGIGHGSVIKDFASIMWNVNISGDVVIGEGAFLGTNATILQRLSVGAGAIIGAGSAVISDIPAGRTAVGVPAKVIK